MRNWSLTANRRPRKVFGAVTGFLYDHKRLLHETDELGQVTHTYTSSTTDEFGDLIGENGEFAHQYDAMANTEALLDEAGVVHARYKYTAFGEISAVSIDGGAWSANDWPDLPPALSTEMLAGGKKQYYLDQEISLYLLGGGTNGRYYDPGTASFISEDPIRQAGGDPNLFTYVQDDPVNKLDPSGHKEDEEKEREARRKPRDQQASPLHQVKDWLGRGVDRLLGRDDKKAAELIPRRSSPGV